MAKKAEKDMLEALEAVEDMGKVAETSAEDAMESDSKRERRKSPEAYLKLDLMPGGYDLKAYVMEQAGTLSAELGRPVSATAYIQRLIKQDMSRKEKKTDRERYCDKLRALSEEKYKVVKKILDWI